MRPRRIMKECVVITQKNNGGIMDKKTENVKNEKVVFYAPLPVNKPYPIIRPSEKIQLQPTVNPVAIVPYLSAGE